MTIRIATRRSPLAVWQSEFVAQQLRELDPGQDVELVPLSTQGDRMLDSSLAKLGGKGLFIKELEQAILDKRADIAVHSMKDVPAELPESFSIPAVLQRHDPRDALVGATLAGLKQQARIGTSSLRRQAQLACLRPDLVFEPIRGNVGTRLDKLENGDLDAIVLAVAGLQRLGLDARITQALPAEICLPAIGQGAIGIESLRDGPLTTLLSQLDDQTTRAAVDTERELSRALGASCVSPLAGHAVIVDDNIVLHGLLAHPDGSDLITAMATGNDPLTVGRQVAERMARHGARALLDTFAHE